MGRLGSYLCCWQAIYMSGNLAAVPRLAIKHFLEIGQLNKLDPCHL